MLLLGVATIAKAITLYNEVTEAAVVNVAPINILKGLSLPFSPEHFQTSMNIVATGVLIGLLFMAISFVLFFMGSNRNGL